MGVTKKQEKELRKLANIVMEIYNHPYAHIHLDLRLKLRDQLIETYAAGVDIEGCDLG